jgi:hypothetical protein
MRLSARSEWAGSGCDAWARAWLRDVSPNTLACRADSNENEQRSPSRARGADVCAQASRLFSGWDDGSLQVVNIYLPRSRLTTPESIDPTAIALLCCLPPACVLLAASFTLHQHSHPPPSLSRSLACVC